MKHMSVVTTIGSLAEARRVARAMVERKLAAYAQISTIESFFMSGNVVQNYPEYRVQFKTTFDQYPVLEQVLSELHTYEVPEIHAFPLEHVYAPYAAWIEENSRGS